MTPNGCSQYREGTDRHHSAAPVPSWGASSASAPARPGHKGLHHGPVGAALSFCALGGDFSIESGPRQSVAELPGAWGPGGCGIPQGENTRVG